VNQFFFFLVGILDSYHSLLLWWGGGEVGAIHFLLGTKSLLVMDCECNNTLLCTLVASAQIFIFFIFFIFFRNDEIFKNNLLPMENKKIYEKENEEYFLEYSIFELESSNLFIYLFIYLTDMC
jgi:hypothetical protein